MIEERIVCVQIERLLRADLTAENLLVAIVFPHIWPELIYNSYTLYNNRKNTRKILWRIIVWDMMWPKAWQAYMCVLNIKHNDDDDVSNQKPEKNRTKNLLYAAQKRSKTHLSTSNFLLLLLLLILSLLPEELSLLSCVPLCWPRAPSTNTHKRSDHYHVNYQSLP